MSLTFVLKNDVEKKENPIEVSTQIDEDGDVEIRCNGKIIAWLNTDGRLFLCDTNGNVPGLDIDNDDFIRVMRNDKVI